MSQIKENVTSKRIVVSGINGYIATALGLEVLRAGHILVGTSRSTAHEADLRNGPYSDYSDRFVYYHVPDMTVPRAFDAALADAHIFLHTASPISSSLSYATSIAPALQSVESALASAAHAGPQFESLVYMSSIAAVLDKDKLQSNPGYAFTEADWNERAVRLTSAAIDSPETVPMMTWYSASKVVAERALFAYGRRASTTFTVASVLPAFVYGPPVLSREPVLAEHLSLSMKQIFALYSAGEAGLGEEADAAEPYVDLRDVVAMCMWLLENPQKANGQRFLAAKGAASPKDIWNIFKSASCNHAEASEEISVQADPYGWPKNYPSLKSTRAEELMGLKFRGVEEAVLDSCAAFAEAGVKQASA